VRDLIERVLQAQFGANWWTTAIPGTIPKTAAKHKADEKNDPTTGAATGASPRAASYTPSHRAPEPAPTTSDRRTRAHHARQLPALREAERTPVIPHRRSTNTLRRPPKRARSEG
jgi:hypothetical protein